MPFAAIGIALLIGAGCIAALVERARANRDRLLKTIRLDPEAKYIEGKLSGRASFEFAHGRYRVQLDVLRRGDHKDRLSETWCIQVLGVDLDPALHCRIEKAGYGSILRNELGFKDIGVGDADFDRDFDVFGSKHALIPDFLKDERLRTALRVFFESRRDIDSVSIGQDGCVEAKLSPRSLAPQAWHDVAETLVLIADIACGNEVSDAALSAARENNPHRVTARPATKRELTGVGTTSGAPIGFGSRTLSPKDE